MMTETLAQTRPAPPTRPRLGRLQALVASFRWSMEMRRRCERRRALGLPLDHAAIRRLAEDVDAWVAGR